MSKIPGLIILIQMLLLSNVFSNGPVKNLDSSTEKTFYISPNGNDENTGTKDNPFHTLERAKLAMKNYLKTKQP